MAISSNRFIALIIAILMMLTMLSGCKKTEDAAKPETPTASPSDSQTASESPSASAAPVDTEGLPYADAYKLYAPDTPMITVGEFTVTWEQLYYYLCNNFAMIESNFGEITDWTLLFDGEKTYAEAIKYYAGEDAISDKAIEVGAKIIGEELTETDLALITDNYSSLTEQYGGEDALIALLNQNHFPSKEQFLYLNRIQSLVALCFTKLYGTNGAGLTDADVAEKTADDGYLMAKHILRLTQNEDRSEKTDEEKAAVLAETEEILAKLDAYDGDDFDAYFDELMAEYSEDPGSVASPGGYLFQNGDMVPEFYDTCLALEPGEYSKPVKTSYGYHIIYRIPVDYDAVPTSAAQQGNNYPLRYIVAATEFEETAHEWLDSVQITYSKEYDSLDVVAMFG